MPTWLSCIRVSHLLPKASRLGMGLYESSVLAASRKVALDQARLAIKLASVPNPIHQALLSKMAGPRPSPKAGQAWERSIKALKSAGVRLLPGAKPPSRYRTVEGAHYHQADHAATAAKGTNVRAPPEALQPQPRQGLYRCVQPMCTPSDKSSRGERAQELVKA